MDRTAEFADYFKEGSGSQYGELYVQSLVHISISREVLESGEICTYKAK